MTLPFLLSKHDCVVFDLDDTLYKEQSFVKSGIKHCLEFAKLSASDEEVLNLLEELDWINYVVEHSEVQLSKEDVLNEYRTHLPLLELDREVHDMLNTFLEKGIHVGIITDGRSVTQRNKLNALGILEKIDTVIISEEIGSEKPSQQNFRSFDKFNNKFYVGDNPKKDFVAPNSMGWTTIMLLNNGENIHEQNIQSYPVEYHPHLAIEELSSLMPRILSFG